MASREVVDIALEEYRALWAYYGRTLDERERLIANYLKIVALPSGVLIGFFVNSVSGQSEGQVGLTAILGTNLAWAAGIILFLLACVGTSGLFAYAHETKNSRQFLSSINALRAYFRSTYPELGKALIAEPDGRVDVKQRVGMTGRYRAGMFLITNSGILFAGLFLLLGSTWTAATVSSIYLVWFWRHYAKIVTTSK